MLLLFVLVVSWLLKLFVTQYVVVSFDMLELLSITVVVDIFHYGLKFVCR